MAANSNRTGILGNFNKVTSLLAPGEEGIKGLGLSNAMYLSSWLNRPVNLPIYEDLYHEKLHEKIYNSTFNKQNVASKTLGMVAFSSYFLNASKE